MSNDEPLKAGLGVIQCHWNVKQWCALQICSHSWSSKLAPFDRPYM